MGDVLYWKMEDDKGGAELKKTFSFALALLLVFIFLSSCATGFKKHTATFGDEYKVDFSLPPDWYYTVSESDNHIIIADNDEQDYNNDGLLCFISIFEDNECENFDGFLKKYVSTYVGLETLFTNNHTRLFKHTSQTISGTDLITYSGLYYNQGGIFHCQLRPVYANPDVNTLEKILKSISISE
jgi:hypothetical protein